MSKEKDIKSKITKYYGRTLLDSRGERCKIIGHTYFNGTREIQIVVSKIVSLVLRDSEIVESPYQIGELVVWII